MIATEASRSCRGSEVGVTLESCSKLRHKSWKFVPSSATWMWAALKEGAWRLAKAVPARDSVLSS